VLRHTKESRLNPVTRCFCKKIHDDIKSDWLVAANAKVVTFFSGLPGGNRNNNGTFNNVGNNGNWWSASAYDTTNAWNRNLNYNNSNVNRNNNNKTNGFSVRVVRDLKASGSPISGSRFLLLCSYPYLEI